MTTLELFPMEVSDEPERIGPGAFLLRGFALPFVNDLLPAVRQLEECSPFRNMATPGGRTMSVALTNCGTLGWVTDLHGYRYTTHDPMTGKPWPAMPRCFELLAKQAAAASGFGDFEPDACLVNRYLPGARMALHQDKDERDFTAPIVSVSLGMTAVFLFGGLTRSARPLRVPLRHGDVVVWGADDRLRYHGILPLKDIPHALLGSQRINFTFRKAG